MKGAVVADQESSMMTLTSVRPSAVDLADEVVGDDERREILSRILDDAAELPPRLVLLAEPPHRRIAAGAMVPGLVAAAVLAVVAVSSVLVSGHSTSQGDVTARSTSPAMTLAAVRQRTVAAVAGERGDLLDMDVDLIDAAGRPAGSLRVLQSADGRQVLVDELDADGAPSSSTLVTSADGMLTDRTVDHRTRTWSEASTPQPEGPTDGDPSVVYAARGAVPMIALSWVGSPRAVDAVLSSASATLDHRGGQLVVSAPLSVLGSVSRAMADASQLLPGATVELSIDRTTHLPTEMVVHDSTGETSNSTITWTPARPITLAAPVGYTRR
jgi:hypothetical protein